MATPPNVLLSRLGHLLRAAVSLVLRGLRQVLISIAAVVVVFMEWGWRPLAELLGLLARLRIFARLELLIRGLPPYGALAVFVLPSLLVLPLKLISFVLIAKGYKLAAAALFAGAKIVGTALVARIYMLTQVALMRIGWFKRAYEFLMPIKTRLLAYIRESTVWRLGRIVKTRIKRWLAPVVARARTLISLLLARFQRR